MCCRANRALLLLINPWTRYRTQQRRLFRYYGVRSAQRIPSDSSPFTFRRIELPRLFITLKISRAFSSSVASFDYEITGRCQRQRAFFHLIENVHKVFSHHRSLAAARAVRITCGRSVCRGLMNGSLERMHRHPLLRKSQSLDTNARLSGRRKPSSATNAPSPCRDSSRRGVVRRMDERVSRVYELLDQTFSPSLSRRPR